MPKKTILVVDDDADLLKMLKLRLEAEGYIFMGAQDGEEMLMAIKIKRPDVILLDIMLPKKDGYTALREMRSEDLYKDIPVIILTAKEKKKVEDLFALEGVVSFVEKPYDTGELLRKIRSIFNG